MSRRSFMPWLSCLLLLTAACGGEPPATMEVGTRAPSFNLEALEGGKVSSKSLEGEVLVVNFWATWCQPCLQEIPELNELAAESHARVVGIALDKDGARVVKPFVERHNMDYDILIGNEELFLKFHGANIPHTVVLDSEYNVAKVHRGRVTKEDLEKIIDAAM